MRQTTRASPDTEARRIATQLRGVEWINAQCPIEDFDHLIEVPAVPEQLPVEMTRIHIAGIEFEPTAVR